MTTFIAIASVLVYGLIGWIVARRDLPAAIAGARDRWTYDDIVTDSAMWRFVLMWAFWPGVVPVVVGARLVRAEVERSDPVRLQRRIDELERELLTRDER